MIATCCTCDVGSAQNQYLPPSKGYNYDKPPIPFPSGINNQQVPYPTTPRPFQPQQPTYTPGPRPQPSYTPGPQQRPQPTPPAYRPPQPTYGPPQNDYRPPSGGSHQGGEVS